MSLPVLCLTPAARLLWENFQQTLWMLASTLLLTLLSVHSYDYLWGRICKDVYIYYFFNTTGELRSARGSLRPALAVLIIIHMKGEKQAGECSAVDAVLGGAGLGSAHASANLVYATGKRHSASAWDNPQASYLMLKKDISSSRPYMRCS